VVRGSFSDFEKSGSYFESSSVLCSLLLFPYFFLPPVLSTEALYFVPNIFVSYLLLDSQIGKFSYLPDSRTSTLPLTLILSPYKRSSKQLEILSQLRDVFQTS